ncbi:MAG: hypothetical protein C0623_14415 [Desulfuromonas sp.]|nr:MAG: hypothetical protein C0623_14415 [Desulfuromonas sp.]
MHVFIRDCQKVEELASQIYKSLATNDSYPNELREAFTRLSKEEENHSRNLELLLQLRKEEISNFKITWDKTYSAMRLAEKFLAMVDEEELDQGRALTMALEMEKNFMQVHAHNVLEFNNPQISAVFEELWKEDLAHCDTLRKHLEQCS